MTIQTQSDSLFLELVFDGERPMYINPRLYCQHHAGDQGNIMADQGTVMYVHTHIVSNVMRIQSIDHLYITDVS